MTNTDMIRARLLRALGEEAGDIGPVADAVDLIDELIKARIAEALPSERRNG